MLAKSIQITLGLLYAIVSRIKFPFYAKRLLIVKLDAIGDYVLFRNCIPAIKNEGRFKNYKIYLLGNIAYKELAEAYDHSFVDQFIWIHPNELFNLHKRLKLLLKLKLCFFETVINPVHSRVLIIDRLLREIRSKSLIGSKGDTIRLQTKKDIHLSNSYYNELIEVPDIHEFEFLRNVAFTKNLLNDQETHICLKLANKQQLKAKRDELNIIIVPGAGLAFRRWHPEGFAKVIDYIGEEIDLKCNFFVTGSKQEESIADQIKKCIGLLSCIAVSGLCLFT